MPILVLVTPIVAQCPKAQAIKLPGSTANETRKCAMIGREREISDNQKTEGQRVKEMMSCNSRS